MFIYLVQIFLMSYEASHFNFDVMESNTQSSLLKKWEKFDFWMVGTLVIFTMWKECLNHCTKNSIFSNFGPYTIFCGSDIKHTNHTIMENTTKSTVLS